MAINKVVYGATTLVDLTDSTVTPETLALGQVAYNAAGERIVGTMITFAELETDGYWQYRIFPDNTFEAHYARTGVTFDIKYASGTAIYRSDPSLFSLPDALSSGTVRTAQAQVFHTGFPAWGALGQVSPPKVQAMSTANRGSNSNYTVLIDCWGEL